MIYDIIGNMGKNPEYFINGSHTAIYYSYINGINYTVKVEHSFYNAETKKCLGKIAVYNQDKLIGQIVYDGLRQ